MSSNHGDAEPAHWSSYWARGCLTSLPQDFRANYDGEIAGFWQRQFAGLPDGARILDVCTGNGAVALLAAGCARANNRRFHITGIDAARIDPEAIRRQHPDLEDLVSRIDFESGCRFEQFDPSGAGFDLLVSQYGIEYCDWESAAARASELLRPGGRLAFVSHAVTTDILKTMEAECREYDELVRLQVLPGMRAWANEEIGQARLRSILEKALPELRREFNRTGSGLYRYVLDLGDKFLAASEQAIKTHRGAFVSAQRQLDDGHARLRDLLEVNRAIAEAPDWVEAFTRNGLDAVESGSLHYRNSHRAGDYYVFQKPE